MLNKRYQNDGKALLKLNRLQVRMRDQINKKISLRKYLFEELPCGLCNGRSFETLSEKDRYGLSMHVVICKDCGLIQTNPRMNKEAYKEFYDTEYRDLYSGIEMPSQAFFDGQVERGRSAIEFIEESMKVELKGNYVLEIGCGSGGVLKPFRDRGCDVKGCDLGSEYLSYGKEKYNLDIEFADIKTVSLKKKPDIIIYMHVFEHILDLNDELHEIHSLLSDDGFLYIYVPSVKNIKNVYESDFLMYLQNAHTYHFTLATLKNILRKNGFNFICGDEMIHSIFSKGKYKIGVIENDYHDAMKYLNAVESHGKYLRARALALYPIKKTLELLGLKDFIKKSLKKMSSKILLINS